VGAREVGEKADAELRLGDGFREGGLEGIPNLVLPLAVMLILDSVELVRRCDDGKVVMLLWMIGDGSRNPTISDVPFRLGRTGLRDIGGDAG
jgi:hypothetical protein